MQILEVQRHVGVPGTAHAPAWPWAAVKRDLDPSLFSHRICASYSHFLFFLAVFSLIYVGACRVKWLEPSQPQPLLPHTGHHVPGVDLPGLSLSARGTQGCRCQLPPSPGRVLGESAPSTAQSPQLLSCLPAPGALRAPDPAD